MPATTAGRRALSAFAVLPAAVLAGTVLVAAPAAAHAVLTDTRPERGATVTEQLDAVVLEFNEGVVFPQVQVTGPDGGRVEEGLPVERGQSVEQPLLALAAQGTYRVVFRVTSDDGHPVEGAFEFTYQGPIGDADADDPLADAESPEQDGRPEADGQPEEDADAVSLGGPALVVALLVLLGFAGAAVLATRGRRSGDGDGDGGTDLADPTA